VHLWLPQRAQPRRAGHGCKGERQLGDDGAVALRGFADLARILRRLQRHGLQVRVEGAALRVALFARELVEDARRLVCTLALGKPGHGQLEAAGRGALAVRAPAVAIEVVVVCPLGLVPLPEPVIEPRGAVVGLFGVGAARIALGQLLVRADGLLVQVVT